ALHLAATRPAEVSALVLCGTPLELRGAGVRWLPLLARIPCMARRWATIPKPGGPDIADPAVRAASRSYRAMPLGAVLGLLRPQAGVRGGLGRVTPPARLRHARPGHGPPVAH